MLNSLARNDPRSTPCEGGRNRISRCRVKSERIWKIKSLVDENIVYGRIAYHRYHCCRGSLAAAAVRASVRTSGEDANAPQGLVCADALFEVLVIGESTASVCCCLVDPRRAIVRARYRQQGASTRRRAAPPSELRAKTPIYVWDPAIVRWLGSVVLWQLCSSLLCPRSGMVVLDRDDGG